MKTSLKRLLTNSPWQLLAWLLLACLLFSEPLLANKFETIGGGVQGSAQSKIVYLRVFAYVASAIFLLAGVLAILLRNRNAQTLNYTMWKPSSVVFFLLGFGALVAAVLI